MLNKTTLGDQSVAKIFDMMIWLTAQYGPCIRQSVPKIVSPVTPLHERCWRDDDPRPVFTWAEAEGVYLSKTCNMEDWSIQVAPDGNRANLDVTLSISKINSHSLSKPLKSSAWNDGRYSEYFVDYFGRPTFFYDPRRCEEPGYFAKTLLPQFALLKIFAKNPPAEFGQEAIEQLTQVMACHMGVGFTMLALSQGCRSENWTPMAFMTPSQNTDELPYLYGTLVTLAAHGLTREQIIATYGKIMTQSTRKLLGPALAQIESQTDVLKLLKLMSRPMRSEGLEHNHPHQVRLSGGLG